jgi:hypothetical protein
LKFGQSHRCCTACTSELLWNHFPGWLLSCGLLCLGLTCCGTRCEHGL